MRMRCGREVGERAGAAWRYTWRCGSLIRHFMVALRRVLQMTCQGRRQDDTEHTQGDHRDN